MRILLIWLLLISSCLAQLKATGVATWEDTVANRAYGAWGIGGDPVLCYQDSEGEWQFIKDEWVQVGESQIWKSVKGNHRVFADSTGAAIYAVGNHYLGTETTHLIKFDKSDSTWETLKSSDPDSVTVYDNRIRFHNIFPGVHKILNNNAKVIREYSEVFEFTQQARDSLTAWGPWSNRLLGTATKLGTDSLNLTWADVAGVFALDETGHMVDDWVELKDGEATAFYIAGTFLRSNDTIVSSIPIKKWLVQYAGSFWFIEMFNPVTANQLPEGTLWHDATFGYSTATAVLRQISDDFYSSFGAYTTPGSTGDLDSLTAYLRATTADKKCRLALYIEDSDWQDMILVDSTEEFTVTANGASWFSKAAIEGATVTSGVQYAFMGWGENPGDGEIYMYSKYLASGIGNDEDTIAFTIADEAYEAGWPSPNTTLDQTTLDNVLIMYATFDLGVAETYEQVIIINTIVNLLPWGIAR